jgi:hypothetical protein
LPTLLQRGGTETASLWPDGRVASHGVQRAAHVLTPADPRPGPPVKRRLGGLLGAMTRHRAAAGRLTPALPPFLQVLRRAWPGLLHGSEGPDVPRTHNDLAQSVGAPRDHERRATGRPGASPALVHRGAVRVVAATATRVRVCSAEDRAPQDCHAWKALRQARALRRQQRTLRDRFRRAPGSYLAQLEADLLQLSLPP